MFLDLASCETYSSMVRKKRDCRLKESNTVGSRSLSRMDANRMEVSTATLID